MISTFFVRFMLNDPQVYRDPSKFNPERFLGSNPEPDSRELCFGFGRRYAGSLNFVPRKLISNYHRLCPGKSDHLIVFQCAII